MEDSLQSDQAALHRRLLGRGRSGAVYLQRQGQQPPRAVKVFKPDTLSKLVLVLLSGAPNPYAWNADAAQCVVLRRRVLAVLLRYWFGSRLRVPITTGPTWNPCDRAYQIDCEWIRSSHLPLSLGLEVDGQDPYVQLRRQVMRPLQRRLIQSGCVGLVWQAGLGNPVAGGNFMLDPDGGCDADRPAWVWIDLESGIPALLPLNPLAMVRFYLPQMLRRRALLFDDVDIQRLTQYLANHRQRMAAAVSPEALAQLQSDVQQLGVHQHAWKALGRTRRSLDYAHAVGRLSDRQRDYYQSRPLRWYALLLRWSWASAARHSAAAASRALRWLGQRHWRLLAKAAWHFCVSHRFRLHLSKRYVYRRLQDWRRRRFLDPLLSRQLRAELRQQQTGATICDFGVHIALKAPVKLTQYVLLPAVLLLGLLDPYTWAYVWALTMILGGITARTLYTTARTLQCLLSGRRRPWVALAVGMLPMVGNAAFPLQLLYDSVDRQQRLARFILHDTMAGLGRAIPIWGGSDSLVEHFFNRLPNWLLPRRWQPQRSGTTLNP